MLALGLLLLTIISCLAAGTMYRGIDVFAQPLRIYEGWRFATTILGILRDPRVGALRGRALVGRACQFAVLHSPATTTEFYWHVGGCDCAT
jgi:hypothetical protein